MLTIKNPARWSWLALPVLALVLTGCTPAGPRALWQGKRLIERDHYAAAIEKLTRATSLLPTNARAWNYRGLAHHLAGQPTNALACYQKALALDRDLAEARYNLGCLLLEQGKWEGAKTNLTSYTLHRPNVPEGWIKLGTAQLRAGELAAAEKSFQAAHKLNARLPEALNGLGLAQAQRGRPREAVSYFEAALKQQPRYAPALLNLAIVSHQHLNDRPSALQRYKDYLALKPPPAHVQAVSVTVRQLERELNPPARVAPTNVVVELPRPAPTPPAAQTPPATNVAPPVAVAIAPKIEPVTNVPKPAPAPPKPSPPPVVTKPLEVVQVPGDIVVRPAQDVLHAPPLVKTEATDPSVNRSPLPQRPIAPPAEKPGALQRMNPANWFRRDSKDELRPTPLPGPRAAKPAEAGIAAGETTVPSPSTGRPPVPLVRDPTRSAPASTAPVAPRYAYRSLRPPAPGNRKEAERWFAQGVQAHRAQRLAEAMQSYRMAAQSDPAYFEAQYNLGLAAYDAGSFQQALGAYEVALAIQPDSAEARYNFGLALKQAGYAQDAANELEKLVAKRPDEARAHFLLANLYAQQLQQPQWARSHYLKLLALQPRHPQATEIRYWLAAHPE